jgi:ABC-2 type transport system ATP-binding protein
MTLEVKGLTRCFGTLRAVDDLSFTLASGEVWGFIGPNGAGKTTTLRMLATIDPPTAGDAFLDGVSMIHNADDVRPRLGFMPDYVGSYTDMLVAEYLDFFARAYGLHGTERRARIGSIVEFVALGPLLDKRVTNLSKGMRQRLSLSRALLNEPQLLLLDEPAAGLDPAARKEVRELLRILAEERSVTIFVSSHILAELEGLVDKVLVINEGRKVYDGSPREYANTRIGDLTLNLRVVGDLAACQRLLLETPDVRRVRAIEPDGLAIDMTGGREQIATIVQQLVAAGHVPYHVASGDHGLETLFMETTRRNAPGPQPPPVPRGA